MKSTTPKFNREQVVFMVEVIFESALDRIESGMPTSIEWGDRVGYCNQTDSDPKTLTAYDRGALETAGMAIAVVFAQLTDDGMGIGDALHVSGFQQAIEEWVSLAWHDGGATIKERMKQLGSGGWQIKDAYTNYPDCRALAEKYVDECFDEYFKCPYCGGNCPAEADDSDNLCDGFAGDIDGLLEEQRRDEKRGLYPQHDDPAN